jgi:CheY-like chemotaxis protein
MPKAHYKILIVEDEKIMQDLLIDRLSKEGIFQIFTANNGQEGLANTFSYNPDLILLDIRMPIMDGIEMLKELRKDPRGKDVSVIFLTNYDTDEGMLKDISEGKPSFYLIKSTMNMDDVVRKIKESLHI